MDAGPRMSFYSYYAGEAPPVKRVESDYEVPVVGFKDSVPVVVPKMKPAQQQTPVKPKTVVVQTDSASGKKFIVVNGKRVEVKEVIKVKKNVPLPVTPAAGVVKSGAAVVKKTCDAQTSTDDLFEQKTVSVQTEEPRDSKQVDFYENDEGFIIREDVKMGDGPKCPTPQRTNYYDKLEQPLQESVVTKSLPSSRPSTREALIMQYIQRDYQECQSFDPFGNMPIHCAVIENNLNMVKRQCIAMKFRGVSINTTNYNGLTPLQLAIFNGSDPEIFEVLLHSGADASIVDTEGNNVIHLAVLHSNEQILDVLLQNVHVSTLDSFNYDGLTPLMVCCCNNKVSMAAKLLRKHVNPNTKDQKSGRTAIFHAVEANDVEMVKLLIMHKADPKVKNFLGMSAHDAVFEIDDLDKRISQMILGREHQMPPNKGRSKRRSAGEKSKSPGTPQQTAQGPQQEASEFKVKISVERKYQKCYINNKIRITENSL